MTATMTESIEQAKAAIGESGLTPADRIKLLEVLAGLERTQAEQTRADQADKRRDREDQRRDDREVRDRAIKLRTRKITQAIINLNLKEFSFFGPDASAAEKELGRETAAQVSRLQDVLIKEPDNSRVRGYLQDMLEAAYDERTQTFRGFGFQDKDGSIPNPRDTGFLKLVGETAAGTNVIPQSNTFGKFIAVADELSGKLHPTIAGAITHYKLVSKIGDILGCDVEQATSEATTRICQALAPKLQVIKDCVVPKYASVAGRFGVPMKSLDASHPSGLGKPAGQVDKAEFPAITR